MKKWIFRISILTNILFILAYLWINFNSPSDKLGVLKEDVEIGYFMSSEKIFKLPKGLTVRDISPQGIAAIGQFENNRFQIVITTNRDLIDYKVDSKELNSDGNYYSADIESIENEIND